MFVRVDNVEEHNLHSLFLFKIMDDSNLDHCGLTTECEFSVQL